MRTQGRFSVDPTSPRAKGVCDRCGALYQLSSLRWQYQFQGPKLQNLRILACSDCLDKPQEQLRTFILPPDPEPVQNPRPENYVADNNPLSGIGAPPQWSLYPYSGMIGNMTMAAGPVAAFDGNTNKPASMCAFLAPSSTSSYVGKNWNGDVGSAAIPSQLEAPDITHTVTGVTAYAPNDMPFLASGAVGYIFSGSSDGATWTTIASGTTAGTNGEELTISSFSNNNAYAYHRFSISGDGVAAAAIAQLEISVGETG